MHCSEEQKEMIVGCYKSAGLDRFIPEQWGSYALELRNMRDILNMVETAYQDGFKIGLAEAKAEIEVARKMKNEDEPIEKIVRFTGLTKEQINRL